MQGGQHRPGGRRPYRQRVYCRQFSFLELSDEQCLQRLRFRKDVLRELCNVLRQDLEPHKRFRTDLTIETKVTITLNVYATGYFQSATADITIISQFSAHRSIWQVTDALYRGRVDAISFPMTREKQVDRQAGFINVQLVCDHQHRILVVDAKYPGSSHDSFILRQTSVPAPFTGPNQDCGWLLGEKGYHLSIWLLTPLWNPRTVTEHAYSDAHSGTRCIIEHCIGILQQRFHGLDRSGGALQYSPEQVSIIVVVCCMLHNLALMKGPASGGRANSTT
uniref:putative nuclease HARBI1 n=1 Tax=Pristiophorus japonicus TaxID=55135 RepID=UPI00398E5639